MNELKLSKCFTLIAVFLLFCGLNMNGQGVQSFSDFSENDDMQEIDVLYDINTNTKYFIPIEDENGELIRRYNIIIKNEGGDIMDSYKILVDTSQPVVLYETVCLDCDEFVESDFLTLVAAVDPAIVLTNNTTTHNILTNFNFETHEGLVYSSNNFETLSNCLAQIANEQNIVVTDVDINLSFSPNISDCQSTSSSILKNGWHFEETKLDGSYFHNGNLINYTYSTITTSQYSSLTNISFDIGYKAEISYSSNDDANTLRISGTDRCRYQILHCTPPRKTKSFGFKNDLNESEQLDFNLFPNPCQNYTNITYTLAEDSKVCIDVYNILGEQVACISNNEYQMAGEQRIEIDMSNLPIGQYICQISEKKSKIATQRFAKIE